jgi:hypothetical protein
MNGKTALRNWLAERRWDIAGELTFADGTDYEKAKSIMDRYWFLVNTMIYKNGFKRHNKQIERVVFRHGDGLAQNNHFHFALRIPSDRSFGVDEFINLLSKMWRMSCGKHYIHHITPMDDSIKNINYISRHIKNNNFDSFEILSSHLAEN